MVIKDSDKLNLPEAPDFMSEVPKYTMQEMMEICEKMLPFWNKERLKSPPVLVKRDDFTLCSKEEKS